MLQIEELKQELLAQQPKIEYLKEALGYQKLLEQKKQLDEQAAQPDFWNDAGPPQPSYALRTGPVPAPSGVRPF